MAEVVLIQERHLEELAQLYEELSGKKTDITKMKTIYEKLVEKEEYILLGFEKDGILLGTVMGIVCLDLSCDCRNFMVIENMVVKESARREGVGRALINELEKRAMERDCYYIILLSAAHRVNAHEFYEKLGYSSTMAKGFKKTMGVW